MLPLAHGTATAAQSQESQVQKKDAANIDVEMLGNGLKGLSHLENLRFREGSVA